MTDVQNWVDQHGNLITSPAERQNSIDLSTNVDPVKMLHQHMGMLKSSHRYVKYLSLARCDLTRVPPIFLLEDMQRRQLSAMVEYMTFYGNKFLGMSAAGEHYTLSFNATGATIMNLGTSPQTQAENIWSSGFSAVNFTKLKELDLRACSIQVLGQNLFKGMSELRALYIGENEIFYIDSTAFAGLNKLVHLDFSRNQAFDENGNPKNLATESYYAFQHLNLISLDLSFTKLTQRNLGMLKSLGKSLRSLSLCETGLNNLHTDIFLTTSLQILDVSRNNGILQGTKPLKGIEDSLIVLYAQEVGLNTMDIFQNFTKLAILQLANNEINNIEASAVRNLRHLKVLDLNKNRINSWFNRTYSLMPELSYLSLKDNNINLITEEMIEDLMYVDYLALSENSLICNCHSKDLYKMAAKNEMLYKEVFVHQPETGLHQNAYDTYNDIIRNRNKVELNECDEQCYTDIGISGTFRFVDYSNDTYICLPFGESKPVQIADVYSCGRASREKTYEQELKDGRLKLLALLTLPCVMIIVGMIYMFRRHIRYFYITMRNSAMLSLINKKDVVDDNTIFNYDVFVSYCNEDRGWVLDHLLPHMETECSISACLHERDFLVGLSILENIVSCMDRSRSIMLILSQRFLLSQWCQFEMHLAQHRLLETRREDLTLILLEDIPRRLRPNTLHYLMLTKTYIVWPKDEAERPIFWKRLKKTLIAQKTKPSENVSLA
uniref:SFRICE_021803 n=1 Tax=Spodoptera frugiperda TaxID=7108 RepID=A0A2H1WD12_SPOFR